MKSLTKKSVLVLAVVALSMLAACGNARRKPLLESGDPQSDGQVITHCPVGLDTGTLNYSIDNDMYLSVVHTDDDLARTAVRQSGSGTIYGLWRLDGNFSNHPKIDLVLFLTVSPGRVELMSSCGSGVLTRTATVSSPATISDTQISILETHDSY